MKFIAPKELEEPTTTLLKEENTMKKIILKTTLAAVAVMAGSTTAFAWDNDAHYKDLYELRQLHTKFHQAVSHAGINATTKAKALDEVLALWTDDGVIVSGGVTYTGKGTPNTASCDPGAFTLCDFYNNHAGGLVLGHDWVSLTPIFTESITLLDHENAAIYFQCIYFDVTNNDIIKSNATFGLPSTPDTARAKKVHGQWRFSYGEFSSIAPPTLDFYQQ
jgi:hypothetical protein